ncbi:MAG: hypothetical protein P4L99_26690 [Chthoniobacter sp.]|nr:hypothetical protein [Chthoniobacter sp.]
MNVHAHPLQKTGILSITGGIHSEEAALTLKAALEDLPGVYATETTRNPVRLRFDPYLVTEQQFYGAAKIAGFHASDFTVLPES